MRFSTTNDVLISIIISVNKDGYVLKVNAARNERNYIDIATLFAVTDNTIIVLI